MPLMAKKRRTDDEKPVPPNRTGRSLHVYISPALDDVLAEYIANSRPRTNKTGAVEAGLEILFKAAGLWPAKGDSEGGK